MKNNIKLSVWALILLTTQIIHCPVEGDFESTTNQAPHDHSPELHDREVTHYPTDSFHHEHNQNIEAPHIATAPPAEEDQDYSTKKVKPIQTTFTFHKPSKESTENNDQTFDGVSAARREEIQKMTPEDFEKLDSEIMDWSPEEIQSLTPSQVEAFNKLTISYLQLSGKITNINIALLNPNELADAFTLENKHSHWSDEMVQKLTIDQIKKLLDNSKVKLDNYFSPEQIAMMRNKLGDADATITKDDQNPADDLKKGTKQQPEDGFTFHKPEKKLDNDDINIPLHDNEVSIERQKEIAKLTPEKIKLLDEGTTPAENIALWSIPELRLLSPEQTDALTARQLSDLQTNGKIMHLDIASLNPQAISHMFLFENKGRPWSDLMINDLTPEQKQAILDTNSPRLDDYFSLKQIAKMRAQIDYQTLPSDLPYQPQDAHQYPQVATAPPAEDETPQDWGATAPPADDDNSQPTPEDQPSETPQKENGIVAKAIAAIKSSWFGKLISDQIDSFNDHINKAGARRTAASLARMKAERTFEQKNQPYFDDAMRKLTTKEKENVANQWLDSKEKIYQKEQNDIKAQIIDLQNKARKINDNTSSTPADLRISDAYELKITELSDKLHAHMDQFAKERRAFKDDMQATLTPSEVMIELSSTVKPYDTEFEIMDMHKIDPTRSIEAQYNQLSNDMHTSKHILSNGKTGRITAIAILDTYATWVTGKMTILPDSSTSISEQLNAHMKLLTNIPFDQCDESIQRAILKKLPQDVQEKYKIETDKKIDAAKEPLRSLNNITRNRVFLSLSPEIISQKIHPDYMQYLTPETIARLTLAQTQALTPDQLAKLNMDQLARLQISNLTPEQLTALMSLHKTT